jgi:regulator of CtrA degradation
MDLSDSSQNKLTTRVVNALYTEAMLLADEARSYFDNFSQPERDHLNPLQRVSFSCESLKVTTRLMHIIAWLMAHRGFAMGEADSADSLSPRLQLGNAAQSDPAVLAELPADARTLIEASTELYRRVERLDAKIGKTVAAENPALSLQNIVRRAY